MQRVFLYACLLGRSLSGFHVQLFDGLDRSTAETDLGAVAAGLQNEGVLLDGDHAANDTADGGDLIADLQRIAHLGLFLLLLLLGPVNEQPHEQHHDQDHDERAIEGNCVSGSAQKIQCHVL